MSLFDEILDENRPPPTYDYPSADDIDENDDDAERRASKELLASSEVIALGKGSNELKEKNEEEEEPRLNDDLRTRLSQRLSLQGVARPPSTTNNTSRPSSRDGRPASAASSADGDDPPSRPRSNTSASSNPDRSTPPLSKQVQRLAKLGVALNKAPKLSAPTDIVDLSLPEEAAAAKSEKSSALDRWFMSKFQPKKKTTADSTQPATISCSSNMAVKDETGATVIERKVIVLNKAQHGHQPRRGVQGHKAVKSELEAALARKRQAGLQQRKEWYDEDNPKSDAEESDAELTDEGDEDGDVEDEGEDEEEEEKDDDDDPPPAKNKFVDDEAIEDDDDDGDEEGDDDAKKSAPRTAVELAARRQSSASDGTGTQPFCLRLDGEPDTLEMDMDSSEAGDASATEHSAFADESARSDIDKRNWVKKQISTADFFDDDDEGDVTLGEDENASSGRPTFLRPQSPTSTKEDTSKKESASAGRDHATEFPMLGCSTPARPSHSKQSNGMFVTSHDTMENADSQAFMSVDLHLPESLSQWAADTSYDTSLTSNNVGDVTNEEANTDAEGAPSQLLDLCSGKFSAQSLPPATLGGDTAPTSSVDSDLLRLCSGVFPEDDATQPIPHSQNMAATSHEIDNIDKTPTKAADIESDADERKASDGYESNESKSSTSSSSQRKKVLVKRRKKRAVLSDSEEEEEIDSAVNEGEDKVAAYVDDEAEGGEEEEGEDEEEEEEGDEGEEGDTRNSSDDEVAVFRRLEKGENKQTLFDKNKKLRRDFYDEEAELSGSDVGSGDEQLGSDNDVYEAEEGDQDELPDEEELRNQVNRAFLKQQHDEDKRNVLLYQEALLPDGDLHHDDGNRRFRWRQREEEDALVAGLNDEMQDVGEQVDVDVIPEDTDAGRIQLIKWRASQDEDDKNSDDDAKGDSQLLKMGQIAIQRQISAPPVDVSVTVKSASSRAILGGTSFLKRDATTLSLLSKGTGQSSATNAKSAAPNSLFLAISSDTTTTTTTTNGSVKRPSDSKDSVPPLKRSKPATIDSIFRHFTN